jgi:hypothetical protein
MLLFITTTFYLQNNLASANNIQQSLKLSESPTSSPMALMLENTQTWSCLILINPMIHYGSVACSSNLFHSTCQIKFFFSVSPTWKVVPLMCTWMTLLHPKTYPLLSSSGYHTINCIILLLSFWHAVPSAHPPHLIHIWHCPSISVLVAWYYIPQTQ